MYKLFLFVFVITLLSSCSIPVKKDMRDAFNGSDVRKHQMSNQY